MQEYVENLRLKPAHYKERVLYGVVAGVTLLLFLGWISSLSMSDKTKKEKNLDSQSGPFSMISESFVNIWNKAKSGGYSDSNTSLDKETNSLETLSKKEIPFGTQVEFDGGDSVLNEGTN